MPTPLPNPQSLLAALNTLERTLAEFEKAREESPKFSRSSSDTKVTVVVNALGRFMSVHIEQDQLVLGAATLAAKVRDVANLAIDAAYAATRAAFASFASTLSIPGLPAFGSQPPDYADFNSTAATVEADILANNPCESTKTFTCASGPVTAVVDSKRRVVSLTYPTPLPKFAAFLAAHTLQALNCAVDDADPIPDPTPGITTSLGLHELAIYGKGTVKLNDRVKVKGLNCAGWGNVGNRGTVETNIGVEAEVGKVASRAKVILRDRGKVHGFLITSDVLERHNQTVIDGLIAEHSTVLLPDLVLNVPFPGVTIGTIELEPGQQQTAGPGYYHKCHPKQNAQVFLSAGVYYFNEFFLEPGSKVWLNQTSGPVVIYVKNSFTFRGSFNVNGGAFPRVFVGYLGTSMAIVEAAYKGTLAAPNAKISISTIQSHEGAFHGKDVEAQPDNQICHRPFELRYEELPPGVLPPPVVNLGFETPDGWSSPQSTLLTLMSTPVTQGTKSLRASNPPGTTEIVSANFPASLAPQGCTRCIVDLFVPWNQPNGSLSVIISVPSAGVNNVNLGSVSTTGRPQNQFSQFEFALPTAVRTALDGTATDVSIKLVLAVAAFSGPWYIDNVRFLLPPAALSTLNPILSFEDTTKWSCAQTGLTSSTTVKTHLTKSLKVNTAPGSMTIVSVPFATGPLNAPLGKFRIDLRKPSNQPNPGWHGQFSVQFDVPSAGITNAVTSLVDMTPLPANTFALVELTLPENVKLAVNSEYNDLKIKLIVNAIAGSGPWHFDNIRFV